MTDDGPDALSSEDVVDYFEPPALLPSGCGTISRYRADKGFGFIARYGEPEVFFHVTDLTDPDIPVATGQRVRFGLIPDQRQPGRFVAIHIHRMGLMDRRTGDHDDD